MVGLNVSEQVVRLAAITNALANGQLQRAMGSLGWMSPPERSKMAKAAGCTAGQVSLWLDGSWTPPTDQLLVLLGLALERWRTVMGVPELAAGSNGKVSVP